MKTTAVMTGVVIVWVALADVLRGQVTATDFQRRQREMKANHERSVAEMQRRNGQRLKQLQLDHDRNRQRMLEQSQSQHKPPPFYPASAPAPADCLAAYIAAARGASSMDQLLRFLPQAEQRALKEQQARFDPKHSAQNREWHREKSPQLHDSSLTFLSNSPFVNALARHKRIADKFLNVLRVEINGNKAHIFVSTTGGGTVNGVRYPYGTATFELRGEGDYWKIDSYNDSGVVYLHPPQPKAK
jgi:hypothetical protein